MIFAHIAARRPGRELDPESDPTRHDRDFPGRDVQQPEFGRQPELAALRNDQQLAVRVEEDPAHRLVGAVDVYGGAARSFGVARGSDGEQSRDEIPLPRRRRQGQGIPPQTVRDRTLEGAAEGAVIDTLERGVRGGRTYSIHPRPPGFVTGHREGRAGNLFRIESVRRPLG
jgi:hypothetical protein